MTRWLRKCPYCHKTTVDPRWRIPQPNLVHVHYWDGKKGLLSVISESTPLGKKAKMIEVKTEGGKTERLEVIETHCPNCRKWVRTTGNDLKIIGE